MNLKKNLLYILVSTVLCLSIITYPKSVYAYDGYDGNAWDLLQTCILSDNSIPDGSQEDWPFTIVTPQAAGDSSYVITLKEDIIEPSEASHKCIKFSYTASYILDLNGKSIKANLKDKSAVDDGYVIKVTSDSGGVTIKNGTITGGNNTGNGGGIYCDGTLTLDNVTIEDCKAQNGAGIYFAGSARKEGMEEPYYYSYKQMNASSLKIKNCTASNEGGAIYFTQKTSNVNSKELYSRLNISGSSNEISSCEAQNGSAIFVKDYCMCKLGDIEIKENIASQKGTIYCDGIGELYLDGSRVTDNTAVNGGGIYLKGNAFLGGNANVINNKDSNGKNNNLILATNGKIQFGNGTDVSSPSGLMKIGITLEDMQNTNISSNGSPDFANYLVCDDENCSISFNGSNFVFNSNIAPRTSSSKKYKVIYDKTMVSKITGSGKKGSKRTIYPLENVEVESISILDKNDEDVELTKEENGTYTFIQPKSDVTLDITYKQDEIVLNLDSNIARLNGKKVTLDVKPLVRNDRTMLPIRFIAESLGAKVEWNALEANMIYITKGDVNIEIKLDSNIAKINGEEHKLDSVAFAENNRTYLPVRFIAEALNADVIWDESNPNEVVIKSKI